MIIYRKINSVKSIQFCCGKMAQAVLLRKIQTCAWTEHSLVFFVQTCDGENVIINACPFCGSLIEEDEWVN